MLLYPNKVEEMDFKSCKYRFESGQEHQNVRCEIGGSYIMH